MTALCACPVCGSTSLRPFSRTPEAERAGAMHVAQSRCGACDLYRFRSWLSEFAFYALHDGDVWTGRGGRVLVWCRRPT